jgi:hypothetical protein
VGEARGYNSATAVARFLYATSALHWFEPTELSLPQFRQAREGLIQAGDLQYAMFTYASWPTVLDCAPALEAASEEIEAGFVMAARTDDNNFYTMHRPSRQLLKLLRGDIDNTQGEQPACLSDSQFDEAAYEAEQGAASGGAYFHAIKALSAAIFNDTPTLVRHAALAMPLMARTPGYYLCTWIQVLQALALCEQLHETEAQAHAPQLKELDACMDWLKKRALDAPMNFLHLLRWIEAERAWATGDTWAATQAFNQAISEVEHRTRPWHRAFISERAGLFHLAHGLTHSGQPLLVRAAEHYAEWGAQGKVRQLKERHPFVREAMGIQRRASAGRSTIVSSDAVDVLSVMRASQALSSETSLERLNARVGKVLSAMTGAASVLMAIRTDDDQGWQVSSTQDDRYVT